MSYEIEEIKDWPSGDTRVFPFYVLDEDSDNEYLNISGAQIDWKLVRSIDSETVLSLGDSGVSSTIIEPNDGHFEIHVEKDATQDLEGEYREILKIVDSEGRQSSWEGRVEIEDIGN